MASCLFSLSAQPATRDSPRTCLHPSFFPAQIVYNLEAPAYMEEVSGKVVRVEDYGAFVEFQWNNKVLTGLLSRDEMKVPSSALSEEAQAELRAEWADTEFEMPAYADLPDNELDVKKYYAPGQEVRARSTCTCFLASLAYFYCRIS